MGALPYVLGIGGFLSLAAGLVAYSVMPSFLWLSYGLFVLTFILFVGWTLILRGRIFEFFGKKSTRYGANLGLVIFLILGILIFVNVIGKEFHWRKDFTKSGTNTLSPQTEKIVKGLSQDVKVYYFGRLEEKEKNESLFNNYSYLSKHFQYEFVDARRKPTFTKSMDVTRDETVVLSLSGSEKKVKIEGVNEEKLTNALIKLMKVKDQVVYFTVGHGESSFDSAPGDPTGVSSVKEEMEKQGYTTKSFSLMNDGKIPEDAAAILLMGPKSVFHPKEIDILKAWVAKGGRALLSVDLDLRDGGLNKGSVQLADLLIDYGIHVQNRILVDPTSKAANIEPQVLLGFSGSKEHPITKDFPFSPIAANFFFPLTTYLTFDPKESVQVTALAKTSRMAWAESNWASVKSGTVSYDKNSDHQGEMDLAYAIEISHSKEKNAKPGRLAVFGTTNFATNEILYRVMNRDLFLNSLAWLTNDEQLISIRAKDEGDVDRIDASANMMSVVFLVTVILVPLTLLIAGLLVWLRRVR